MTCVVGVVHKGRVYMGADSAASNTSFSRPRVDRKVFHNGPYLMGYTTSFRMGQLLQHALKVPAPPFDADALHGFMVTDFVNAMRTCFQEGGWLKQTEGRDKGGTFLVGVQGRLFVIESDLQVGEYTDSFAAVGSGDSYALGSLHTTATSDDGPRRRITKALDAAASFNPYVSKPFHIIKEQA